MTKLNKYFVYVDDGNGCYKIAVPAENEKAARKFVEGSGDVIAIKNITEEFPISLDSIARALNIVGMGQHESDFVLRTLSATGIAENLF